MIGDRAEAAASEAAARTDQTELYLAKCRNPSGGRVRRMIFVLKRQVIQIVQLLAFQRRLRRVLHHIDRIAVLLRQYLSRNRVVITVLDRKALSVRPLILCDPREIRQGDCFLQPWQAQILRAVAGATHPCDIPRRDAGIQCLGNFQNRAFSHAVDQKISLGIQQDRSAHLVAPVIIMPQSAQACLQPADDDRHILIGLFCPIRVDDDCPVRPPARLAARRVFIHLTLMAKDRIIVDHRVHHAAVNQKPQTRFAEYAKILSRFVVRLR